MTEPFDINKVFEDTKVSVEKNIIALEAKISFIDELSQFFVTNNLRVVKDIPEASVDSISIKEK